MSLMEIETGLVFAEFIRRGNRLKAFESTYDRRGLIDIARDIGVTFRLLDGEVLCAEGRIPRSTEQKSIVATDFFVDHDPEDYEIVFLSHRWFSADAPDDEENTKACSLCEFMQWRRRWLGWDVKFLFWIDYSCLDQTNREEEILYLPVNVACCERMLIYGDDEYFERAWCRLEMALSYHFHFADHYVRIRPGYENSYPHTGIATDVVIDDPAAGRCSQSDDHVHIGKITDQLRSQQPHLNLRSRDEWNSRTTRFRVFDLGPVRAGNEAGR